MQDGFACGFGSAIKIDGADDCFEGIFQHRFTWFGVVLAVGLAHFEVRRQPLVGRDSGQCLAVDEAGAAAIQRTFIGLGEFCVERLCDDEVEYGVTEKFEALVIFAAGEVATGVSECQL